MVLRVWIEGIELTPQEKDAFAWRDGFRSRGSEASPDGNFEDFTSFWEEQHGRKVHAYIPPLVAFEGQVIHWNPSFHVSRTRGAWI